MRSTTLSPARRSEARGASSDPAGFTLLELIVVITIIGILGSIVAVKVANFRPQANATRINADLRAIHSAATMKFTLTGKYPESIDELINAKDDNGQPAGWALDKFPKDPWNHEYIYDPIGSGDGQPVLKCLGIDNAEGGEGEAKDTYYPEQENA